MERKSGVSLFAAKGVMSLLKLAVLFFFLPASSAAQGLKIDLDTENNHCSYHKPGTPDVGLSLVFKELPLLKYKISFVRTVNINYEDKVVELKDKLGFYPVDNVFPLILDSYMNYTLSSQYQESWRKNTNLSLVQTQQGQRRSFFQFDIPVKFPSIVSKFIGEGGPSLKITGNRKISFSGKSNWKEGLVNTATYKPSKWPSLNMEQKYSFKIYGNVGSKISVDVDQNSETTTDLANRIHLRYAGEEDEILQSIELGNTTLSVGNSLVGYSQAIRGLFGIKATAKIGRVGLTMITSQEKSSTQRTTFKAGSESSASYIRDYDYEQRRFFYLGRSSALGHNFEDFQPGDSLVEFELYKSITNSDSAFTTTPHGFAYINPTYIEQDTSESEYRVFKNIDKADYYVYRTMTKNNSNDIVTLPFVELPHSLGETEVLAYWGVIQHENLSRDTIGNLQWKDHGTNYENDTTFLLKLIKPSDSRSDQVTWEYEWRNVYSLNSFNIEKDGLTINIYKGAKRDVYTNNTDPDQQNGVRYIQILGLDKIDQNGAPNPDGIVDLDRIDFNKGLLFFPNRHPFAVDSLSGKIPDIYTATENNQFVQNLSEKTQYYIYVETKSRKTEYTLGHAPVIDGSEVVTLNGKTLVKGSDYNIDYDNGQINFLSQEATDPTAELKIDYEYAPFLMAEKKSLYGLQANYVSASGLTVNTVALYKSDKTSEDRPRVGEEQKKNLVWGTDLSFSLTPSVITKLVDALPLFGTEEPSKVDVTMKVAQSIPNPNLANKAYIDDFESSIEYTDLGIRRGTWTLSSMPQGNWQRARMVWYNPYDRVRITDIWPHRQVQTKDDWTDVLDLELHPKQPHAPRDTLPDTLGVRQFYPDSSYKSSNGIMRALSSGSWDQTRTKYLEVWVRGDESTILHIDLGEISEDVNADGLLQTEDKPANGQRGNGVLEPETEDTGLDGIFDAEEKKLYGNVTDPDGDNWDYNSEKDKNDYSHINGTENNVNDPDRGRRPDTEDINGNDELDKIKNYFEFSISLKDPSLWVPGTNYNGWRLYRIPLESTQNRTSIGSPDFSSIKFARIWLSSSDTTGKTVAVQIASIQLVSNRWRSLGVESTNDSIFAPVDSSSESFEVFVINTYDNDNYNPPPGIAGILDRSTDVREKEQSLVFKYQDLKPGHYGSAYRMLYNAEDYTNYQGLKMYVSGPENSSGVIFFYRMGTDSLNFYEYHGNLYPGWDTRNEVNMDFSQMTALKNYMLINASKDSTAATDTTAGNYRVKGNPTLSRVGWFSSGVYNEPSGTDSAKISGEVWIDELRVTDVRKVPGWYYTGSITTKFADLFNLGITYSRKDADFYGLTESRGSGVVSSALGVSFSTSFEKFLPPSWGLVLPFSFNLTKSLELPRLKPGSDIVLPQELRSSNRTESTSKSFSFYPSFIRETNNWLLKLTLKRLKLSQSIYYTSTDYRSSVTPVSNSRSYGFGLQYDMTPRKNLSFSPFKGLKSVFLLKKLASETISPLPTNLIFSSSVKGFKSYNLSSAGNITSQYTRDFYGKITAAMAPLKTVKLNYNFETYRDIRDDKNLKFSLLPKQAKLGIEVSRSQSFSASYQPKWIGILDQNFSFNSSYKENGDPVQLHGTKSVGNQSGRSANFTFYWQKILGILRPKAQVKKGMSPLNWIRSFVGNLSQSLAPLSINYRITKTSTKSGLLERPSLSYQFGFTDKTDVPFTTDPQTARSDALSTQKTLDLGSALRVTPNINISSLRYSKTNSVTSSSGTPVRALGTTFPDMALTWSNLEKMRILKRFASSVDYSFNYRRKVETTENAQTGEVSKKNITKGLTPLSLKVTFNNRVQSNWTWDRSTTESQTLSAVSGGGSKNISTSDAYGVTASYSFSAPKGMKIPFLKKIRFQSNLNLGLGISIRRNQTKSSVGQQGFNLSADSQEFSLTPSAGYSFSSQVTGGLSGRWLDTTNKINGEKSHTRELSIWVQVTF
jgi:cell surface protein SprA